MSIQKKRKFNSASMAETALISALNNNQGIYCSKSLHINDKGIDFVKELLEKYKIKDW